MSFRPAARSAQPSIAPKPRLLVIGTGPGYAALRVRLAEQGAAAPEVAGVIANRRASAPDGWPHLGDLDLLPALLRTGAVDEVALCLDERRWYLVDSIMRTCSQQGVSLSIPIPPHQGTATVPHREPAVTNRAKRAIDVVGAISGLVLMGPILGVAGVAILASDGWPVVFRQRRAGLDGRPFRIWKLRTMRRNADALRHTLRVQNEVSGGAFKMADDPRVTRLGRWLRRTSIDELPQLLNVLKGDMSLVGPRPHPYDDVAGYRPWQLRRLAVKPGITGLWQLELRGDPDFDRWVAKDIEYIDRWSLWLDFRIIAKTIPAVLRGTGN